MNKISRTITGIGAILLGAFLIVIALLENLVVLIHGIPIFVVGFFVLFNKKEDEIEKIKGHEEDKNK
jgi:hypothetical protein